MRGVLNSIVFIFIYSKTGAAHSRNRRGYFIENFRRAKINSNGL